MLEEQGLAWPFAMMLFTDNRATCQSVESPGQNRQMANHVHRDAYAVREYVQRKRVVVTWCSGESLFPDMWTKAVTYEQFHRYWKEMCGYAKFVPPVAAMGGALRFMGAALLSASFNVHRVVMDMYALVHEDAIEWQY